MKLFAIITAALMTTGGAGYYLHSSGTNCCPFSSKDAPVAKSGGCCASDKDKDPQGCCSLPCSACELDCLACCDQCELCCTEGVRTGVTAKTVAKPDCCVVGDVCCIAGAACCQGAQQVVVKPVATKQIVNEECCASCRNPAKLGLTVAIAGVERK